jgi:hypothetical protein
MLLGFLLLTMLASCFGSEHLLLFGDSIDRFSVQTFCEYYAGIFTVHRMPSTSNETDQDTPGSTAAMERPYYFCTLNNGDTVSTMHLFGSNSTPPYTNPTYSHKMIPEDYTGLRISYAIKYHYANYGPPTRIILNVGIWDVFATSAKGGNNTVSDEMRKASHKNYVNLNDRLDDIYELINHNRSIDVGLRTSIWSWRFSDSLIPFNNNIRRISQERNLTLYDLDLYVWSIYNYDTTMFNRLFFDDHHPHFIMLRRGVETMLGYRHNAFYTYRGVNRNPCSISYQNDVESMKVKLMNIACRSRYDIELVHPTTSIPVAEMVNAHRAIGEVLVNNISYRNSLIKKAFHASYDQLSYLDWRNKKINGVCSTNDRSRHRYVALTENFLHTHFLGFADIFFVPLEVYNDIPSDTISLTKEYESCMLDLMSHYNNEMPPAIRIRITSCEEYYVLLKHVGFIQLSQSFYNNLHVAGDRSFNLSSLSLAPPMHFSHDHIVNSFFRNEEVFFWQRNKGMNISTVIDGQIRTYRSSDAFLKRYHNFKKVIGIPRNFHTAILPALSHGQDIV